MIQHVKDNWLWYTIAVCITIITIWILGKYINSGPSSPPQDTFYYKVIDSNGNTSCNHDSGIRPSKTPEGETIHLQVLKKEYNDGNAVELSSPVTVKLGMNYQNLEWTLTPINIEETELYYIIDVIAPKNPYYNMNIRSYIDLREEIIVDQPSEDVQTTV